jgi:hypothetical protein
MWIATREGGNAKAHRSVFVQRRAEFNRVPRRIVRVSMTPTPWFFIEFDAKLPETIVLGINVLYREMHLQFFGVINAFSWQENDGVTEILASKGDRANVIARADDL